MGFVCVGSTMTVTSGETVAGVALASVEFPLSPLAFTARNYVVIRGAVAQPGFGVSGDGRRPHLRVGAACGRSALNVITRRSRDGIPSKSRLQVGRGRRQPRGDT